MIFIRKLLEYILISCKILNKFGRKQYFKENFQDPAENSLKSYFKSVEELFYGLAFSCRGILL